MRRRTGAREGGRACLVELCGQAAGQAAGHMRVHRRHRSCHLGAQRIGRRARAPRVARGAALHGAAQRIPSPGNLRAGGAWSAAPLNSLLDIDSSACLPHARRTCGGVDTAATRRKYVLTNEGSTDMLTTPCIDIFLDMQTDKE